MLFGEKCKMRDAKLHGNVTSRNGNPHCQLDFIWNHVGFTPPAVSVRVFTKSLNSIRVGPLRELGRRCSPDWIRKENVEKKTEQLHPSLSAFWLKMKYDQLFHALTTGLPTMMNCIPYQIMSTNKPFLPEVASVKCFIKAMSKVNNGRILYK